MPGTTTSNPIDYSQLGLATVRPGQTWYIETFYNPQDFGYDLAERNDALNDSIRDSKPRIGDTGNKVLNSGYRIADQAIPTGWDLRLQNVTLIREVTDVDETSYSFFDTVRILLAVTVPEATLSGNYLIAATLQRSSGEEQTISLTIVVTDG
jgi:hypothetical protein